MPLTEDEQKALDERINEMVNKGVHGALSDFGRKQAEARKKDLETGLAEFGGKLMDQVKELLPKVEPGADPKKPNLDPDTEARLKQAEAVAQKAAKDAEKAQRDATAEKTLREAAEKRAQQQEERQALQEALVAGKVRPGVLPMALGHLHARVERDPDSGTAKFKDNDGVLQPIAKGIADYLKTPEGQELLPARNAGGSGSGKPGAAGAGGSEEAGYADLAQHVGFSAGRD